MVTMPNPNAYIALSSRAAIFQYLDACIKPNVKKIGFITGERGAGVTRLLETWAKREEHQGSIIHAELMPAPKSSIPPLCVVTSLIWRQLTLLRHARDAIPGISPARSGDVPLPRAYYTERHAINLFLDCIVPELDQQQIVGICIDNASLLDETALHWLLQLQSPADPVRHREPLYALIFAARLRPKPSPQTPFVQMVQNTPKLRLPWHERRTLQRLTIEEFVQVWVQAMATNLGATFDDRLTAEECSDLVSEYWQKTGGSWIGIEDVIAVYHEELGNFKGKAKRTITATVIERVRQRLEPISWEIEESQKS